MRIDIPEERKLLNTVVVPLRWGDMDALGHINNTLYFRYMETVRVEWLRGLMQRQRRVRGGQGIVIANAFCNFLSELVYPGEIVVRHFSGKVGNTSFDTFVTMHPADRQDVCAATGGATVVWVDMAAGRRPAALPDWLREELLREDA